MSDRGWVPGGDGDEEMPGSQDNEEVDWGHSEKDEQGRERGGGKEGHDRDEERGHEEQERGEREHVGQERDDPHKEQR